MALRLLIGSGVYIVAMETILLSCGYVFRRGRHIDMTQPIGIPKHIYITFTTCTNCAMDVERVVYSKV